MWTVDLDGSRVADGFETEDQAWVWLLRNQPHSTHYAVTYGGYSIQEVNQ